MFVLVGKFNNSLITKALKIINFDESLKYGETMLRISNLVVSVHVNTRNLNLITRSRCIDQIVQNDALFLSWYTTRRHRARRLLNRQFLVIPIHSFQLVKLVCTITLTVDTRTRILFCLLERCMVSGSLKITTDAPEEHLVELGIDTGALCDNTSKFY